MEASIRQAMRIVSLEKRSKVAAGSQRRSRPTVLEGGNPYEDKCHVDQNMSQKSEKRMSFGRY
jgi:hypothetical protein